MLWKLGLIQQVSRFLPERADWPPYSDRYSAPLFPALAPGVAVAFPLALAALVLCYRAENWPPPVVEKLRASQVRLAVNAVRKALRISNDETAHIAEVMELAPMLEDNPPSVALMKRFLAKPHSGDARLLLHALASSQADLRPRATWVENQFVAFEKTDFAPPPLITGDDLTAAGAVPGPAFKRALDEAYDAQLEGQVRDRQVALQLALALLRGIAKED
jgi:hypothetical protein